MAVRYNLIEPNGAAPLRAERRRLMSGASAGVRLAGLYGIITCLHLVGWGLFLHYSSRYPVLIGLGLVAYMLGLRHAFDADHIAAIDDTVRYMLQKGKRPVGVGFFFALGHSTIVFFLAVALMFAALSVKHDLPGLKNLGGILGASVSGIFLLLIGVLNLLLLLDVLKVWHKAKSGEHSQAHLEKFLIQRGPIKGLIGGRLQRLINHSWQMYPLGLLFGLGFDTASEVGLLAMTAGAAVGNMPAGAVLSLPLLFAAGMSLMDTTDAVLMLKAYSWAFLNPVRKIFYNLTITGLSIAVALIIGTMELLQVFRTALDIKGPFFDFIGALDFEVLGFIVVGVLLVVWGSSVAMWTFGRIEQRDRQRSTQVREHVPESGVKVSHQHPH